MTALVEPAAALASAAWLAWAVRGRSSAVFAPSVYRGAPDRPSIALTFDDGPSESTPKLLDILARHGVPATFFLCGQNARRLPGVARSLIAAGHEPGNHTYSHARLWLRPPGFIRDEVVRGQRAIEEACGASPRWFRAPFGVRWPGLAAAQSEASLMGVMWTAIGGDWKLPANAIARRLLRAARPGAILCLHDGRRVAPDPDISETLAAVNQLIPALLERGFHFETVGQILCPTTTLPSA